MPTLVHLACLPAADVIANAEADTSSAFDTLDHEIPVKCVCSIFSITGIDVSWIKS